MGCQESYLEFRSLRKSLKITALDEYPRIRIRISRRKKIDQLTPRVADPSSKLSVFTSDWLVRICDIFRLYLFDPDRWKTPLNGCQRYRSLKVIVTVVLRLYWYNCDVCKTTGVESHLECTMPQIGGIAGRRQEKFRSPDNHRRPNLPRSCLVRASIAGEIDYRRPFPASPIISSCFLACGNF